MRTNTTLTDEQIVARINQGETNLFGLLYEKYAQRVLTKCLTYTKEPEAAADLLQDIFIKVYSQMKSFRSESKFATWLYAIANNYCIDYTRKLKTSKPALELLYAIDLPVTEEEEDKEVVISGLLANLEMLPFEDQNILKMKYLNGKSLRFIQSKLGVGESAVKMRIKRAKERLARLSTIAISKTNYNAIMA